MCVCGGGIHNYISFEFGLNFSSRFAFALLPAPSLELSQPENFTMLRWAALGVTVFAFV